MTATLTTPPATPVVATVSMAAARAVGATKRYGSGGAAVTALNDVTVDFHAHQFTAPRRWRPSPRCGAPCDRC